jgi:UDP:flavonoid glycosyltransferase YjiC (YdhE family)
MDARAHPAVSRGTTMARILFVWELGKGFGHLAPYLDLVAGLKGAGHDVEFAARDVGHAEQVFGKHAVPIVQAPLMMHNIADPYRVQYSLSHLLHNAGFAEPQSILGLVKAWRRLFDHARPDLAIFDHSPTALLAARACPFRRIVSGSGFLIPPAEIPLPLMRYWMQYDRARLTDEESRLLAGINQVQKELGEPALASVSELYAADDQFLLGFEEMDHYPQRRGGRYLGMFSPADHGAAPQWPAGFERRVFAYLHPYRHLAALLELLARGRFATIAYGPEIPSALRRKFAASNLVFSEQPLDMSRAAAESSIAVTNATFGTTAALLLQGRPVLCIPTNLERVMVARRVVEMGAGLAVEQARPEGLQPALRALFTQDRFMRAAEAFRDRYRHLDAAWQTRQMQDIINRLAPASA